MTFFRVFQQGAPPILAKTLELAKLTRLVWSCVPAVGPTAAHSAQW